MAGNPFTKATMFFGLLRRLERGEGLSVASVAQICGVKEAAAREYLEFLAEHRELTSTEEGGQTTWRLKPGRGEVRKLDDAVAVAFAQVALSALRGTRVQRSLEAVAGPIHNSVSNADFAALRQVSQTYQRLLKPEPPPGRSEVLDALLKGLHESRRCRVTYAGLDGRTSTRDLEPLQILENKDVVYVFAINCADGRHKTFDVDGMVRVEVLEAAFRPPVRVPDPAELLAHATGIFMSDAPVEDVVLIARDWPAAALRRRRLHPSQYLEPLAGDRVRVRLRVQCTPDFVGLLLGFLPHVRPEAPPSLVAAFEERRTGALPAP